ncbi:porphobilinogen synthase [Anaplasma phagocytophilum]|uniref:porphobilinogen synthase n=1 Tax=Anaplasma phagocytophilum TaxID=948 RepID=UPI0007DF2CB3|nr:porphobilinogen synthase [Anaplasma phagocytophilum]SBO30389.1 Delta-aminolevulinic acid dehydratase [Anaplasma phagocytophilum]SBO30521.1 Delta-aminolevulinic acid dehydratase [Anaplasma phagocytophilum]SBO30577.1 Delta-aminolevulinic acid dehydratase [Anaplasma phagocytophilum]SCV63847.1 Delta-aminolevulinic acid dehydratase [Anaplasma phagocytophilum]
MQFPKTRLRRKRAHGWMRAMVRETVLHPKDLILPIFIHEKDEASVVLEGLDCMRRVSMTEAANLAQEAHGLGISAVILFPADCEKSPDAAEACNPENLVCRTIRLIKESVPDIGVMADVALDPYTTSGHDGIVVNGVVDNDATLDVLCKQAVVLAAAGCDVVAPSEMMDGRVGVIREFLDNCSFSHVSILSYAAKFCSHLHRPFRVVVGSRTASQSVDKSTYHMDPANAREALLEAQLDIDEGADMILVKPGIFYLDVLSSVSNTFDIPVLTYQVSGEYAMLKAAALQGWLDYEQCMHEALLSMKRAGARNIITYAALEVARKLRGAGGV